MEAKSTSLVMTVNQPCRYVIPIFQRFYSWGKEEWERMWEDFSELFLSENRFSKHFMGSLVFIAEKTMPGSLMSFRVIDGQQRLMTISLLMIAIRDIALEVGDQRTSSKIQDEYIVHPHAPNSEKYRIFPRQRDRHDYVALIENGICDEGKIKSEYEYFKNQLRSLIANGKSCKEFADAICSRIEFVNIVLDDENPFKVFRSLNSTGLDLSEGDLIRNFVFSLVKEDAQDEFDDKYWHVLENKFEKKDPKTGKMKTDSRLMSGFLRDNLMVNGEYVGINSAFENFEGKFSSSDPFGLVRDLSEQADLYNFIRIGNGDSSFSAKLNAGIGQIRNIEASTVYPLLLNLINRVRSNVMSQDDMLHCVKLVSGFVMRRYICSMSSRTYGYWFVDACKIQEGDEVESLRTILIDHGFPGDAEFQDCFLRYPIYSGNYNKAILKEIEMSLPSKERASLVKVEIEHIMPQALTLEWRTYLGDKWSEIHVKYLHTPGNLALTQYNQELSNKSFFEKRKKYQNSGYCLTKDVARYIHWDENSIVARGKWLSELANKIWIGPNA